MIFATPLSCKLPTDKLMWHYDSRGLFSVKSDYKVAFNLRYEVSSLQLSSIGVSIWKAFWKANVPGKVKMCAWKACCDIMPTHASLELQGVAVDNICLFCSSSSKSTLHVFSDYPFARSVCLPLPN